MSFNALVPLNIHDLRKRLKSFQYDRMDVEERYHDCDCEHCPIKDPLNEKQYYAELKKIDDEEQLVKRTLGLLILYAKDHQIEIPEEKGD